MSIIADSPNTSRRADAPGAEDVDPVKTAVRRSSDIPVPDVFEALAAGAALAAAFIAGRCVEAALAGDVRSAWAFAIGFAGLITLETLLVHCGAWRDCADIFASGRRRSVRRFPTAMACFALAAWMHPLAALAALAIAMLANAPGPALGRTRSDAIGTARAARNFALADFAIAAAAPHAVKAAGLEMAFARRTERALAQALPAMRSALFVAGLRDAARVGAGEAAALAAGLIGLSSGALPPADIATLALLAARTAGSWSPRAPHPTAPPS